MSAAWALLELSSWGYQHMAPLAHGTLGTRAHLRYVWQVVDLPVTEGLTDQPTEELIARIQAELDEAALA
jgi:hypothetical protein